MPDEPGQPGQQPAIVPDLEEARRFLQLLDPEATYFTFQVFEDDKDRQRRERAEQTVLGKRFTSKEWIHHGPIDEVWEKVCLRNQNRYGLAVCPNGTDGRGRKNDNIIKRHALWLDRDETLADLDSFIGTLPLLPQIVVETSPTRYHFYFLTEPFAPGEADQYPGFLKALADNFQGDRSAVSPCFTLRLPGSIHAKRDSKKGLEGIPHVVRIVRDEGGPRYPIDEVCKALSRYIKPEPEARQPAHAAKRKLVDINLPELRDALELIPVNIRDNRKEWCEVGMALKLAGFPGARELWDAWSRASDQYDPEDQERTWNSFRVAEEDRPLLTIASIFALAKRYGWKSARRGRRLVEDLIRNERGLPKGILTNACILLRNGSPFKLSYDNFANQALVGGRPRTDAVTAKVHQWLETQAQNGFYPNVVRTAITDVALGHAFDPLKDYLMRVREEWGEQERIPTFFQDVFGCPKEDPKKQPEERYYEQIACRFLTSAVQRAMEPASWHRMILILVGDENIGKSLFVRDLAVKPEWHTDNLPQNLAVTKEVMECIAGKWIIESSEMASMRRSAIEAIKAFISRPQDSARLAYGHDPETLARRCILIATTNSDEPVPFGDKHTRYLPVKVGKYNRDYFLENRDQIWGEAMYRYRAKKPTWITPEIDKLVEQHREGFRAIPSFAEEVLKQAIGLSGADYLGEFSSSAILEALKVPAERFKSLDQDVADALKSEGYWKAKPTIDGKQKRVWRHSKWKWTPA